MEVTYPKASAKALPILPRNIGFSFGMNVAAAQAAPK
jgi:hypothetical protein